MNILKKIKKTTFSNDWTNKTVVVFGDSIVAGQELIREQTPYRDIVYAKIASQYLNARVLHNFAETGTGQFKGQQNLDRKTGWVHNFEKSIKRYAPEVQLADVVIVAYGNNDWKQPNPDGSMHSIEEVKQKLRDNINRIRKINGNVQIVGVLETVAFRKGKLAWHTEGPNKFTYAEMIEAYTAVYNELDVAIFDIRDYHIGNSITEYVDDRDHFTKFTHRLIGEALTDFVKHGYKSPVMRHGNTTKVVLPNDGLDYIRNSESLKTLISELSSKNETIEFLFADNNVAATKINNIKNTKLVPADTVFTNMYDYLKDFARHSAIIPAVGGNSFMNISSNGLITLNDGNGQWRKEMSHVDVYTEWLDKYISTKDTVFVDKNGTWIQKKWGLEMTTILGIRCTKFDSSTERMYKLLGNVFPNHEVVFFINGSSDILGTFPNNSKKILINNDTMSAAKLFHGDKKIGWKAGDYSYCLGLQLPWDYMWLFEPDIFISDDMIPLMQDIDSQNIDLITSKFGQRSNEWPWTKYLQNTTNFYTVYGAFFPLTRLSRHVAEKVYDIRKEISQNITENPALPVPNDESVVGTVAHWLGATVLDVRAKYPKEFQNLNYDQRLTLSDVSSQSGIFHPVYEDEDFLEIMDKELHHYINKTRLLYSLQSASKETRDHVWENFFNK